MRLFVLAIFCAATAAMAGPGQAQTSQPFARYAYAQRPEPPIETSIPVVEKPAATKTEVVAPKPAVRHKVVHRPGKGPAGPLTIPAADVLVMMVRSALTSVNQANFTENYSVLHGMTTPELQGRVSAARFGKAFANLRQQNLDLSPVLVLVPQFTVAPALTPQGVLRLAGIFPSRPLQINFSIDYRAVDGFWLIDALSVSASQSGTPAPAAGVAPPASPTGPQYARMPATPSFWGPHFTRATHFGPRLTFASYRP